MSSAIRSAVSDGEQSMSSAIRSTVSDENKV